MSKLLIKLSLAKLEYTMLGQSEVVERPITKPAISE
jgi:hypothetical protein